ncbi:Co2+/Mg2+ efflux protein ApaG [Caulobacter sp. S45]|uniref:Co2+/Mg2+ efflux protein ApaG n=1 Tax=Caulobacter sp. S45 TaxID=1641861 RepID=UPI00131E5065|nr:Co2+/Mg2+ efflux protein ApaG [Caulobacter sp. S45]
MTEAAYEATTRDITVRVRPTYLPDQSEADERRWVWAYTIEVENRGTDQVQLLSRHWIITDATGRVEEVRGPGVVGEQPVLQPGERFTYTSGCPLPTPSGVMAGSYNMTNQAGAQFDVEIPAFSLDLPNARRVVN